MKEVNTVKQNLLTVSEKESYLNIFQELLEYIDEGIDHLDSYGRSMQVKRSIDRLVETLYSQATIEDISVEIEHMKYISEVISRIKEKRKKRIIKEVSVDQERKEHEKKIRATMINKESSENTNKIKTQIKSSIREALFSVIAHRMDPKKRAGETTDSNLENARLYGRKATRGFLSTLLKAFLTAIVGKTATQHENSFAKHVEESRNQKNGLSM